VPDGDHRPTASLATLAQRARLLAAVRRFFDERGYIEVETPLLSQDTCVDAWQQPLPVDAAGRRMFLQTSPEFAMKRLLVAGAQAIYQITRAFRGGEQGRRHNTEFTIAEWYRAGDQLADQMQVVTELVTSVAAVAPAGEAAPRAIEFVRMTYDDAFARFAGQSVLDCDLSDLHQLARRHRLTIPETLAGDDRDGWLNLLLAEVVEPELAQLPVVLLYDYPAAQAALAEVRPGPPPVAERFELYLNGVEICNGYQELRSAEELRRRMQAQLELRRAAGFRDLPTESRLAEAIDEGLPVCSGVALGFDRLAMWWLGQDHIDDVIAFPWDRA